MEFLLTLKYFSIKNPEKKEVICKLLSIWASNASWLYAHWRQAGITWYIRLFLLCQIFVYLSLFSSVYHLHYTQDVAVDKLLSQTKPSARGSAERDEDGEDDADSDWEEAGKQKKGKRPAVKKVFLSLPPLEFHSGLRCEQENDRRVANQANAETHATGNVPFINLLC